MAKAIRYIKRSVPAPEEIQAQAAADILKAVTEQKEAILDMLAIIGNLHRPHPCCERQTNYMVK